jgi:pimeloyl-ACP methyl ester carboxylesterase
MNFTQKYNELKSLFDATEDKISISGSNIEFHFVSFTSKSHLLIPFDEAEPKMKVEFDEAINENTSFRYPVFVPKSEAKYQQAIILLHGLNERSWYKYLPWAYYLAETTNRPVILFPISFHMSRCPETWANPRAMMPLVKQRQEISGVNMSSFVNVALSQRLSDEPLRFFVSGRQSADDITSLLQSIDAGNFPFLEKNAKADFFGYSIGAFLAQILFLANPYGLLSNSKLFLFCGGSFFSQMDGTSKLIMDSEAFANLRKFYTVDFLRKMKTSSPFSEYVSKSLFGNAFQAMLAPECLKSFRESLFQKLNNQIKVIALKKDSVIPANYIDSTFSCIRNRVKGIVETLDFPYAYSHEMPFPILNKSNSLQVDQSFERVFRPAADFLR